jgi:hypothetical protein
VLERAHVRGINGIGKVRNGRHSCSLVAGLQKNDAYWPGRERKYADLLPEQIPMTESLKDCMDRTQLVGRQDHVRTAIGQKCPGGGARQYIAGLGQDD